MRKLKSVLACCVILVVSLCATTLLAATPTTMRIEGVLLSNGGSPAADGDYDVTFAIYAAVSGGVAAWTEGPVKVGISGGRFTAEIGKSKAITAAVLAPLASSWLGVKVGDDPELPRSPLSSVAFAVIASVAESVNCTGCISGDQIGNGAIAAAKIGFNYAASSTKGGPALDLTCTGCVTTDEMKFDADVDLAGNSIKAKNGTFSGDIAALSVTATSFQGDGSKLTGIKTPSGECKKAGEVVKGINGDGTLKCVVAMDPSALPNDALNEVSNDLLSNQFVDTIDGAKGTAIPDNTGGEANAVLDFPDIGISQTFALTVDVSNSDLSTLSLVVLPPDDKKTGWVLCDPCGKADEKVYQKTFDKDNLPKSGDLVKWINANPKGAWNVKALDSGFCIIQKPGNDQVCDLAKKTDGAIVSWSIKIQTLSNQKIKSSGDVYVDGKIWGKENGYGKPGGTLNVGAGMKVGPTAETCDAAQLGALAWDAGQGLVVCNTNPQKTGPVKYAWTIARSKPVSWQGGCKSHSQGSGWATYCLDGLEWNDASEYFTVETNGKITIKIGGHYLFAI